MISSNSYRLSNKWAAIVSMMMALVFALSTATFASASESSMQMPQSQASNMQMSNTLHVDMDKCGQNAAQDDCCDDENGAPCPDMNDCKMVCSGVSLTSVLQSDFNFSNPAHSSTNYAIYINSLDSIRTPLNAPPPRF